MTIKTFAYAGQTHEVDVDQEFAVVLDEITDVLFELTYTCNDELIFDRRGEEWVHEKAERIAWRLVR